MHVHTQPLAEHQSGLNGTLADSSGAFLGAEFKKRNVTTSKISPQFKSVSRKNANGLNGNTVIRVGRARQKLVFATSCSQSKSTVVALNPNQSQRRMPTASGQYGDQGWRGWQKLGSLPILTGWQIPLVARSALIG